jgi:thioester reductase-like protein
MIPIGTGTAGAEDTKPEERIIADMVCRRLQRDSPLDVTAPLPALGFDSLALVEAVADIEDTFAVRLPPELMAAGPSVRMIASLISNRQRTGGPHHEDPFRQMETDCVLPADVQPVRARGGRASSSTNLLAATRVVVTGATGFLGGRLAADMLARSDAHLYCLVRTGPSDPARRLRDHLLRHGVPDAAIKRRVTCVDGDLTRADLGLTHAAWDRLSNRCDAVLHAAASVNWIAPYAMLRSSNVAGTLALLRLACGSPAAFHFVSSLSVCYPSAGVAGADEQFDPAGHLRALPLGYAQTKAVSEALVGEAGRRGLPVRIYRPALIAGDSRSGAFNADDLLTLLIRGCVAMGTAPDLDWAIDCEPVDVVSRRILSLSGARGPVFHLAATRPRHWRECLLWMRLFGYPIRLTSYHDWLEQLERETAPSSASSAAHPLRGLRPFFLERLERHAGLTRPELYEETRRTRVSAACTRAELNEAGDRDTPLDAQLLDRYFRAFIAAGHLAVPAGASNRASARPLVVDEAILMRAFGARCRQVTITSARRITAGSQESIIGELTAWRSRAPAGVCQYRLTFAGTPRRRGNPRDVIVKIKPPDADVIAVGDALAHLCDPHVGVAYRRWHDRLGLEASHLRERAIYQSADPRIVQHTPALLGVADLDPSGAAAHGCLLVLDRIDDAVLLDSVREHPAWRAEHIDVALRGLAQIHSVWYRRPDALREQPWIGFVHTAASMSEMGDLWSALARHAAPAFIEWGGSELASLHQDLVERVAGWRSVLDAAPSTLIHHDFNPRNICLRRTRRGLRLCAYDWELATIGAPQRDLAEFLCFVLPPDSAPALVTRWIERYRAVLSRATRSDIDAVAWRHGFAAAMCELLVSRLSMYALIDRVRPQPFLRRVVESWQRIYGIVAAG